MYTIHCNYTDNIKAPVLELIPEQTLFHRIVPNMADRLLGIIFSKFMTILMGVLLASVNSIMFWLGFHKTITGTVGLIIVSTCLYLYWISLLLAMNTKTTKLILQTFEFWFKIFYAVRYGIFLIIRDGKCMNSLFYPYTYIIPPFIILMVLVLCLLDGLKLPLRVKIAILVISAVIFTINALQWTFLAVDQCLINIFSYKLDMVESMKSSARIIAIFAWKQAIYSIFMEPKSSLIKKNVKIIWTQ